MNIKRILTGAIALSLMLTTANTVSYADETVNSTATATKYAYSIGVDHGFVWPWSSNLSGDFTPNVDYASTVYGMIPDVTSYKKFTPDVTYMKGNNPNGVRRIASEIVFLNGHGNVDNVCFNAGNNNGDSATGVYRGPDYASSSGYSYVGLDSTDMSTCDHISFVACNTGKGSNSIAEKAHSRGANSSLGFTDSITSRSKDGRGWICKFNDGLANGYSISRCLRYATEFYPNSDLATYAKIYGDSDNIVASNSSSNAVTDNYKSRNKLTNVSTCIDVPEIENVVNVDIPNNDFINKIIDCIWDIDSTFESSNYKMTINIFAPQDGNGMIKFQYFINGEISTNKAYIAYIENNKVIEITCSQAASNMHSSTMNTKANEKSIEELIASTVSRHKANSISTQSIDEIPSDSIIRVDEGYMYDYTDNELRYERTVFYIVPNTDNAIGEYTTTTVLPLS